MTLPLFSRFPRLREHVPWMPLAIVPTPVARLSRLGEAWGLPELWIKRDDLCGSPIGGNKIRKLEFLLADVKSQGRDILAYGPVGSHWALATAWYGRQLGLNVDLVLFRDPAAPEHDPEHAWVLKIARSVSMCGSVYAVPFQGLPRLFKPKKSRPYLMPAGGASVRSTLGYVNAALELAEQVQRGEMPIPDFVVCALGTGGTAAGLLAGLELSGLPTRVLAIRITDPRVANGFLTRRLAKKCLRLLDRKGGGSQPVPSLDASRLVIDKHGTGTRYGAPSPAGEEAAHAMMELEGLPLDDSYTAKAVAAIRRLTPEMSLSAARVLYWHTYHSQDLDKVLAPP